MSLEILFGAIYLLCAVLSVWSAGQLNAFLRGTRSISDERSLRRFKSLARTQMFQALAAIVLMGLGVISGIVVIARHGLLGLAVVLAANILTLGLGLYLKRVETRTRSLQASSEILAREYRKVCDAWVKKALPDF